MIQKRFYRKNRLTKRKTTIRARNWQAILIVRDGTHVRVSKLGLRAADTSTERRI